MQPANRVFERRCTGRPARQMGGLVREPRHDVLWPSGPRIGSGQRADHVGFPGGERVQVHQHAVVQPWRQLVAGVEAFRHRHARHRPWAVHDRHGSGIVDEHRRRRGTEVRERHAHAAGVHQAHAREVLTARRQRRVTERGVHGAVSLAPVASPVRRRQQVEDAAAVGEAERAGHVVGRVGRLAQPDHSAIHSDQAAAGDRGPDRGNGPRLDGQRPAGAAAGAAVTARIVDVAREPERDRHGGGRHGGRRHLSRGRDRRRGTSDRNRRWW